MGWQDVRGDREIHDYWLFADDTNRMRFVGQGEAQLACFDRLSVTLYLEFRSALQDQKDLVTQVVAVSCVESLTRLHLKDAGSHLGRDEEVLNVFGIPVVVDSEWHGVSSR